MRRFRENLCLRKYSLSEEKLPSLESCFYALFRFHFLENILLLLSVNSHECQNGAGAMIHSTYPCYWRITISPLWSTAIRDKSSFNRAKAACRVHHNKTSDVSWIVSHYSFQKNLFLFKKTNQLCNKNRIFCPEIAEKSWFTILRIQKQPSPRWYLSEV